MRILVDGPSDLAAVHRLQDGIVLTPSARSPLRAPVTPKPGDGPTFVAVVNEALAANPPPPADAPMLARLAAVGIGPAAAPLTTALQALWREHFAAAQRQLIVMPLAGDVSGGWRYPPDDVGRFGTDYDTRAQVALTGLFANVREENIAATPLADVTGAPLAGDHTYRLRLPARMPVDAFWSLAMYEVSDGGVEIVVSRTRPTDPAANWLPMPPGPFRMSLRNYQPSADLLAGRFRFPAFERI